jgi:hypothetical protein
VKNIEKDILQLISEDNQEKKCIPDDIDYIFNDDIGGPYTLKNLTNNRILNKLYSENEIYTAVLRLEKSGKISKVYQDRFIITEDGEKEILNYGKKVLRYVYSNWIAILALIVSIIGLIFMVLSKTEDNTMKLEVRTTTVAECIALSSNIRINERTKECFENLSSDEFLSLYNDEENMKLYNEIGAYYDKRTEAEKVEDTKKTEEYVNEVIKNLESNPNAYKK